MFSPSSRNFIINALPFVNMVHIHQNDEDFPNISSIYEVAIVLTTSSSFLNGSLMPEVLMLLGNHFHRDQLLKLAARSSTSHFATKLRFSKNKSRIDRYQSSDDARSPASPGALRSGPAAFLFNQLRYHTYSCNHHTVHRLKELHFEDKASAVFPAMHYCLPLVGSSLRSLHLELNPESTDSRYDTRPRARKAFADALAHCRSLETLELTSYYDALTGSTLEELWEKNPMLLLKKLSILFVGCSNWDRINVSSQWFPQLSSLCVHECSFGLLKTPPRCFVSGSLLRRPTLQELTLSGNGIVNTFTPGYLVSHQTVKTGFCGCLNDDDNTTSGNKNPPLLLPHLKKLTLNNGADSFNGGKFREILSHLDGSRLVHFFSNDTKIIGADDTTEKLMSKCPHLEEIVLGAKDDRLRTNKSIQSIANNAKNLKKLTLCYNLVDERECINDAGISLFFNSCFICSRTIEEIIIDQQVATEKVSGGFVYTQDVFSSRWRGVGWFPSSLSSTLPSVSAIYRIRKVVLRGLSDFDVNGFCNMCIRLSHCLEELCCPNSFFEDENTIVSDDIMLPSSVEMKKLTTLELRCSSEHERDNTDNTSPPVTVSLLAQLCKRSPSLNNIKLLLSGERHLAALLENFINSESKLLRLQVSVHWGNCNTAEVQKVFKRLEDLKKISCLQQKGVEMLQSTQFSDL